MRPLCPGWISSIPALSAGVPPVQCFPKSTVAMDAGDFSNVEPDLTGVAPVGSIAGCDVIDG